LGQLGLPMVTFSGQRVLVIEDEPFVALDITQSFEKAGAHVRAAHTLKDALRLLRSEVSAAAVLDFGLAGAGKVVCDELKAAAVPYVIYSGYPRPEGINDVPFISKPACTDEVLQAVQHLLTTGANRLR
jgi:CheY-like chemotaxis protein